MQQVYDRVGVVEELVGRQGSPRDQVSLFTDAAPELHGVGRVLGKDEVGHEEVEEFLLDFGVEEDLVGDMGQHFCLVDIALVPVLPQQHLQRMQRHHILAFEVGPGAHTMLVGMLVAQFGQVLGQRDEDVFGVVFLEVALTPPSPASSPPDWVLRGGLGVFLPPRVGLILGHETIMINAWLHKPRSDPIPSLESSEPISLSLSSIKHNINNNSMRHSSTHTARKVVKHLHSSLWDALARKAINKMPKYQLAQESKQMFEDTVTLNNNPTPLPRGQKMHTPPQTQRTAKETRLIGSTPIRPEELPEEYEAPVGRRRRAHTVIRASSTRGLTQELLFMGKRKKKQVWLKRERERKRKRKQAWLRTHTSA